MELIIEYSVVDGMEADADAVRVAFLSEVAAWQPDRFTYRIMKKGQDGNDFIHLVWLDSPETQQALFETEFFKTFNEGMQRISGGSVNATPLMEWSG